MQNIQLWIQSQMNWAKSNSRDESVPDSQSQQTPSSNQSEQVKQDEDTHEEQLTPITTKRREKLMKIPSKSASNIVSNHDSIATSNSTQSYSSVRGRKRRVSLKSSSKTTSDRPTTTSQSNESAKEGPCYTADSVLDENTQEGTVLVNWMPDQRTGEVHEPSWVSFNLFVAKTALLSCSETGKTDSTRSTTTTTLNLPITKTLNSILRYFYTIRIIPPSQIGDSVKSS
ncbi:hypothetical protein V1512DRAFT_42388 [Lipomyces arxii]|uniref:uncharacterized protein n=1 Tax=Lipomyces arxii TaxID=56418 RepID=UPI0034CF9640